LGLSTRAQRIRKFDSSENLVLPQIKIHEQFKTSSLIKDEEEQLRLPEIEHKN
jgi:hypothetical protein